MAATDPNNRTLVTNRRAHHEYFIEDTFDAGIALQGSEVKSARESAITLGDGYVVGDKGELWLMNVHISEYKQANRYNHEPTRRRKILLKRREIDQILEATQEKGRSCIPLKIYLVNGLIKVELAIVRGKKLHDKRHSIKERDAKREIARARRHEG